MKLSAEIRTKDQNISLDGYIKYIDYLKENNLNDSIRVSVEYFYDKTQTEFILNFSRIQECTNGEEFLTNDLIHLFENEISDQYNHNYETGEVICKDREDFILFAEKLNNYYNDLLKDYYPFDKSLTTWKNL